MKFLLLGDDYQTLYVEDDKQLFSYYFNKKEQKWLPGGSTLNDNRCGYDPYEPEGSPYRYGSGSCMKDIVEISKDEAEKFINKKIDVEMLEKLLKH